MQILKFILAGGTAFTTNIVLLFVFVHFFNIWYLLAATLSFAVSVVMSFTMQKYLTFNNHSTHQLGRQSSLYLVVQLINITVNTFIMYVEVDLIKLHYLPAQIISGGIIAFYSYFLYRNVVFVRANSQTTT
jgi:putative flippase GtrA